ncbi:DUF2804 domain-containing protein [Streptomyces sp. A0592]|uniref:DUF2804 domain-containing protein n=1 Tax=Streptomyces sp. A0592 TaxID=2563099 RepID=UPI00109EAA13|nr:DUF2804 domain-containing protein [Streptomyces sp. A0592]THA80122.1 DUF2804 domain-containing protein [Streptomyces sp. A0592]
MATYEREITGPVGLCRPDGTLDPAAVGWSRRPLHRSAIPGWGRTKRWEYWCVTTPTHLVALTVSDLDYLALNSVYVLEFGPGRRREFERTAIVPGGRGVRLPDTVAGSAGTPPLVVGPERPVRGQVRVEIAEVPGGTRLTARCPGPGRMPVEVDLFAALPDGHETLSVVVPWSDRRFQYTSKHTARPASGTVTVGDDVLAFGDGAWAVLDHGRGRWPRRVRWNWGAASGRTDGHTVGIQLGGQWTRGTGSTENALCVDGRLTKIGRELVWDFAPDDPLAPWTVRDGHEGHEGQVDLRFTPFHVRRVRTDVGLIGNRTDQCFGHYAGTVRDDGGRRVAVDGLLGWAENVRMRW